MKPQELGIAAPSLGASRAGLQPEQAWRRLHRAASARYRRCGRFAWHFARGKLEHDPVFRALLAAGSITPGSRVLDLGCGQALLASLLAECDVLAAANQWPASWGAPPSGASYTGIELMPADVARAERALETLPSPPRLICADMRNIAFDPCDVIVVLDVLHYVDLNAQDKMLARIAAALRPGGRLLLRIGDPAQRARFWISRWVDRAVTLARGHQAAPMWSRTLPEWQAVLQEFGFSVREKPMSQGTPFANVLLVCDLPRAS
ncbi:MAG TPA: class I SAM-dependent methyltransferase [Burkholderiaceae bacterium]|nr:class I SAM-dependent methyltransferase [Burkholderiaceae bacterium]